MKKTLAVVAALFVAGSVSAGQGDFAIAGAGSAPQVRASENTDINFDGNTPAAIMGALDADDGTYNRNLSDCGALSGVGTDVSFDTITITNNSPADATLDIFTSDQGDPASCAAIDTYLAAYIPSFDPSDATLNCVESNDDTIAFCSQITLTIPQGETAVVVNTAFDNADFFDYQTNFTCVDCTIGSTPPPAAQSVPTLQAPGMIAMGLVLLGLGGLAMRRRA
jgi:uncharacterized protein (TIGR03382 family)